MAAFFCDSSAIVKRYVVEVGSDFVDQLASSDNENTIILARTTHVEVAAAIARRLKGGSLTSEDAEKAFAAFKYDLTARYLTGEITPALLNQAMLMATRHALRGYDAIQLVAAIEANNIVANELSELTMVSADSELNDAAIAEGLAIENPNEHP